MTQYEYNVHEEEDTQDVIKDLEQESQVQDLLQHTNPRGIYESRHSFLIWYMFPALGFRAAGKERLVCKLQKSLYKLKQSLRQWYKRFDKFIISCAYTRSLYDPCVYFHKLPSGEYIYLLLYVDNILIASTNRSSIDKLKVQLSSEFEMKDLGEAQGTLDMEIERDKVKEKEV